MNYKEYLSVKHSCELKIKIFNIAVYCIALFAIAQTLVSFLRLNVYLGVIDAYLLDVLFTQGRNSSGNTVLGYMFYGMYGSILIALLASCALTFGSSRLPYGIVIGIYAVDAVLCIVAQSYYQFLVHLTLLIFVVMAFRNRTYLNMLKNNVWGYE